MIDFKFIIGSLCVILSMMSYIFVVLCVPPNFGSHYGAKTIFIIIGHSLGVKHMLYVSLYFCTLFTLLARVLMCGPIIPFVMGVGWRCHFSLVLF